MRAARKKSLISIIGFMVVCCFYTLAYSKTPEIIKVGLESVYKNVASVNLSSDSNIQIGYYDERGFQVEGVLNANQITVRLNKESLYDLGVTFNNFNDAKEYAINHGNSTVPVYIRPSVYSVYTTNNEDDLNRGQNFTRSIAIYSNSGTLLLISNEDEKPLVMRGYDKASNLSLTTVKDNKKYRGAIGMGGTSGLTPYNIVDIEEYLFGVVPKEMPSSWPQEALKAQAVAARSIAIFQYNRFAKSGYNVIDTTTTQVYGGYLAETAATNKAVNATNGQVIRYNGNVAEAVYFSTSGGTTEDAQNVWGSEVPYLKSVKDTYETEPSQKPWTRTITLSEINKCLTNNGVNIGSAKGVQIVSRTSSGRVQELNILGTNGTYTVNDEKIRSFFSSSQGGSLKSRLFSFLGNINTNTVAAAQTSNNEVTVISANGKSTLPSKNLMVMTATNMGTLADKFAVQSATQMRSLTTQTVIETANNNTETVWGDITVYGQGFGHGVGMSQSGAKGMAQAGFSYKDILEYYYTGVSVN
ncbi:SpoIID/LytB domain-containing protein [Cellulosilyticum ruminicola]|uniref:SpoIID/LytB domain-containing protein n=1 Tax=Cellulosilyticum ruminicola TaxID=425254 RepID=UPI0006CF719E|nr:SpoIID/LytB domain-containing protein [Cellulosilyticum ruminicola]